MAPRKLDKAEWHAYFDRVTKSLVGKRAEIEVESLDLGAEIEAEWLLLLGITYDPKSDTLEIALDGVDHLIAKPREIYVEETATGLSNLAITDADGVSQIVTLRDPLMLPPSPGAAR